MPRRDPQPAPPSPDGRPTPRPDLTRRQLLAGSLLTLAAGCAGRPDLGDPLDDEPPPVDGGSPPPPGDAGSLDGGLADAGTDDAGTRDAGGPDEPACAELEADAVDGCTLTPSDVEGPYYLEGAPPGVDLALPGLPGERIVVRGVIASPLCRPIENAWVDVWQADTFGDYDLDGFILRRRVPADDCGEFRFQTVLPGYYGSRPRHIHVKVGAPGYQTLTSQIYFDEDPEAPTEGDRATMRLVLAPGPENVREGTLDFIIRRWSPNAGRG